MIKPPTAALEKGRVRKGLFASESGDTFGAFWFDGPCGRVLHVIASDGSDEIHWEHVSVSTRKHAPTWAEMCFIKDLFFDPEEPVMQLHPARSNWVNNHPNCLHLWRPLDATIPLPPEIAVGFKELSVIG